MKQVWMAEDGCTFNTEEEALQWEKTRLLTNNVAHCIYNQFDGDLNLNYQDCLRLSTHLFDYFEIKQK